MIYNGIRDLCPESGQLWTDLLNLDHLILHPSHDAIRLLTMLSGKSVHPIAQTRNLLRMVGQNRGSRHLRLIILGRTNSRNRLTI